MGTGSKNPNISYRGDSLAELATFPGVSIDLIIITNISVSVF